MIYLNNRDLSAFGFYVESMSGWLAAPRVVPTLGAVSGRLGVIIGGPQAVSPRQIVVRGYMLPSTLANRETALTTLELALAGRCLFRTADRPTVQTAVLCMGVTPVEDGSTGPQLVDPIIRAEITLLAVDGGSEDYIPLAPRLITATPTQIPVGTLPTRGWLHLFGYGSPVTLTYVSANGARTTTLTITDAPLTEGSLALDLAREDVWRVTAAGVRSRVSGVSGVWPALDPLDVAGTVRPTLAVSSGTGLLLARRRWRL